MFWKTMNIVAYTKCENSFIMPIRLVFWAPRGRWNGWPGDFKGRGPVHLAESAEIVDAILQGDPSDAQEPGSPKRKIGNQCEYFT